MNAGSYSNSFSVQDSRKMLALIQEYADKLRALCDGYIEEKSKRQQFVLSAATVFFIIAVTFTFAISSFAKLQNSSSAFGGAIAVISATTACMFLIFLRSSAKRTMRSYDLHQVASTVERLLRTASQYSEHASQSLGDKFEFDIRLAEAEAALRMYKEVFGETEQRPRSFG